MTRSHVTLLLFGFLVASLYADQNLLAPNLSLIGAEFGFSRAEIDQKLGADVNLVFWMVGGVVTLAIGYLSDRADITRLLSRKWMLVGVSLLGSFACLASGFAHSYSQLFWSRAFTGLGIGGSFPLIYSLIADYFPPQRRSTANAVVSLATGVGIASGQLMAGFVGPASGWRVPFFYVAASAFAAITLFALITREPRRGQQEAGLQSLMESGGTYEERIRLADLADVFKVRSGLIIFLQALPGTIPWGVLFVYLNDFYHHDKGFSVENATLLVMAIGLAAIVGSFLGGLLGQWAYNRGPRFLPLLCAATTTAGVLPMALLVQYPVTPNGSLTVPLLLGCLTGLLVSITGPNINTMLIAVNPPERRGSAFSLLNLFNDLGRGLGAWIVGTLAAHVGRVPAFHLANSMWLFCGLCLLLLAGSFPRDEQALQEQLAAKAR